MTFLSFVGALLPIADAFVFMLHASLCIDEDPSKIGDQPFTRSGHGYVIEL